MNTASSETVIETIVKPICFAPSSAASQRRLALLDEARDVLGHHDRVVDDEAGRDRERHQRQVVEAVVEQVHHAERRRPARAARRRRGSSVARSRAQEHEHDERRRARSLMSSVRSTSRTDARIVCARSSAIVDVDRRRDRAARARAAAPSRARSTSRMFAPGCRRMMQRDRRARRRTSRRRGCSRRRR